MHASLRKGSAGKEIAFDSPYWDFSFSGTNLKKKGFAIPLNIDYYNAMH